MLRLLLRILTLVLLSSSGAFAQQSGGAIAGVVRDTTGAVLPRRDCGGEQPALIEKVRSAVTDDQGQYRVVDLRPGTYKVTFTLPGFATVNA